MDEFIFENNPLKDIVFNKSKINYEDYTGLTNPYNDLLPILSPKDLISELWNRFKNTIPLKSKGFDINNIHGGYDKYMGFDPKFDDINRNISYSVKVGYETIIHTKHFLYYLNRFLQSSFRDINMDFLLFLSLQDQKSSNLILNQLVIALCDILENLKRQTPKTQVDKIALNLINIYVENDLKKMSNTYFDIITPANHKRIKKIFPNLIDLLEHKNKFLSFKIHPNQQRPSKAIEILHNSLKNNELINKNTQLHLFREVFENKYNSVKIDWIDNKATLFYFINELIRNEIIEKDYNLWRKVSYCITVNSKEIGNIKNSRATENQDKKDKVNRVITRVLQLR